MRVGIILACAFVALVVLANTCYASKFLGHIGALNKGLLYRGLHKKGNNFASSAIAEQWFTTQNVDHYDPQNTEIWSQRYFVNTDYWVKNGPIWLILGGEGPISDGYVLDHFITADYAKKFGAMMVGVEHRFYGKSMPRPTLSTENLRLLSSEQALADFAVFRNFIVQKYNAQSSKVISFGGSYSGSLSAWLRLKYPHLIDGALATSAPVNAQVDFPQYNEVVSASIGPQCSMRLRNATRLISTLLSSAAGKSSLEKTFNACSPIRTALDEANLMENLEGGIADIVQYNDDNNNYLPMNKDKMCDILLAGGPSDQDALAAYANYNNIFNKWSGANCTQISYDDYIVSMKDIRPFPENDNAAGRSWFYQTCVEFGYYQTGAAANQPFSPAISLQFYLNQCRDIFGITALPNAAWTNTHYGSTKPSGSKIIFPNGSVDPWHALGILKDVSSQLPAFFMKGTAHCADLYPPSPRDVPDLTACRKKEVELLAEWLA